MLVSTALSSINTNRSGAIPPVRARLHDVVTVLLSGLDAAFLSRPVQPTQRTPNGPGIDPYAGLRRQSVAAFHQSQVIVLVQQAAQDHLRLIANERLRPAPHRLGHTATFVMSRRRA